MVWYAAQDREVLDSQSAHSAISSCNARDTSLNWMSQFLISTASAPTGPAEPCSRDATQVMSGTCVSGCLSSNTVPTGAP
eukprot:3632417-Ditylum_brightwellii.AAC.1